MRFGRIRQQPRRAYAAFDAPRSTKKRVQHERKLHRQIADFCHSAFAPGCGVVWTTVGHGGGGYGRGGILKGLGLRPGWPDWQALYRGRFYAVEIKHKRKSADPHQRALHDEIRAAGGEVAVVNSVEGFENTLRGWGFPVRARVLSSGVVVKGAGLQLLSV